MRWPTASEITLLAQTERNFSKLYLGVQRGKNLFSRTLVAADAYSAAEHSLTFGAAVDLSRVHPNMVLACGTASDPYLYGSARIRQVDDANDVLYLEPNNLFAEGYWAVGNYVYVGGIYPLYRKLPYIVNGVIYEDGNPDTALAAAGIPGYGIPFSPVIGGVADSDGIYLDRPIALMGSPRFAWANEYINFYGWRSHGRGGNVINAWQWDFDGGDCPDPLNEAGNPDDPRRVRWADGEYIVSLTVTDDGAGWVAIGGGRAAADRVNTDEYGVQFNQHTAVRPVLVFDKPGEGDNVPYSNFEIESLSGKYGSGWTARIKVFGTADKSEFPDNALVILFADDWYGGTKHSMGGWYGQEGILFCGYVRAGSVTADFEKSTVTFTADSIEQWMKEISIWPANCLTAGAGNDPTVWHEFWDPMTAEDILWYLAEYRSNLKDVVDCFFCSDPDSPKQVDFLDLTEASLYDQMSNQIGSCFFGELSASRQGSVHLFRHKNMLDLAERLLYGIPIFHFQREDWYDDIEIGEERMRDSVAQVDFVGFIYDANGNPLEVYSLAPEHQTNFGRIEKVTGILLSGSTIAAAQPESNTLSGLYRAWKNIRFPHIKVPVLNNRFLEPATLDYFAVTLTDTVRNLDWAKKEFLTTGVSYKFDNEKGTFLVDIEGEASTWGPDGVAGDYPHDDYGPDPTDDEGEDSIPETWPTDDPPELIPPGDEDGDGDVMAGGLIYFVDSTTGRIFRSRNINASPGNVVYEDLGVVDAAGLQFIALDEDDPKNVAMVCTTKKIYLTTNLDDVIPTWIVVLDLTAHDDTITMDVSSPVRDGMWLASGPDNLGQGYLWVRRTYNDGTGWARTQIAGGPASISSGKVEASKHYANRSWIVGIDNGSFKITYTLDFWASQIHSVHANLDILAGGFTQPYHRNQNNNADNHALWASGQASIKTECCTNTYGTANCTLATVSTGTSTPAKWLGGYWYGTSRYWLLGVIDGVSHFYISDDGVTWTDRYAFGSTTEYIDEWRYSESRFYGVYTNANAPIIVSYDRGAIWQLKTGNWAALGYGALSVECCAVVWKN